MKQLAILCAVTIIVGSAAVARAGAPQPDQREADYAHVCAGGPNKAQSCSVSTQDADCPRSQCVLSVLSRPISGTLTLIADDSVSDWLNGGATNSALTVMLEVRAPDGSRQLLAATYQDVETPSNPPQAPGEVVAIGMDEAALRSLGAAVNGLLFARPESTLSQQLQDLFGSTGTPVIVATADRRVESNDHSADELATVVRFKVKLQFVQQL